ncbi:hypothetical protein LPTSP3_g21670 [Leptospira kobayashii]|uniref:YdhG-like domain-containing protein n=1 Tax=Leptospira kobayashii TaxID=1917830 RepID=A0ABN6KDY1_9LEPT|nr:DUF1801 domain-containing protein [Leptospira kobayashii]BDA79237.1 hypothetical protein LPTSP3_g21670 [Leptospira kobayashii]
MKKEILRSPKSKTKKIRFENTFVAEVFAGYPEKIREKLLSLRQLILDTASKSEEVGNLEETLKWGEPSYLTTQTKSGSTIRIHTVRENPEQYAVYFNCQTNLVGSFRKKYPTKFTFGGNRSIIFHLKDKIPVKELEDCISQALTYHKRKA